ncbi:MAG: type IX secretion system protein PorQ [Prolixibacteraceae bacterium]
MNSIKQILLALIFTVVIVQSLSGQTGGEGIFSFLQLTTSAKTAALGGVQVALPDSDPGIALQNPALLSAEMNNSMSFNYANYLAGIGFGYGSYARSLGKYGTASIGIQFFDYGQFVAANENGLITGSFSASDYALTLSWAKTLGENITVGASLKPIYSHLENYRSFGLVTDLGVVHRSKDRLTTLAICAKSLGKQLTTYYDGGEYEKIDWSLQVGLTRQLQYAPLRICITAYDLNHWNRAVSAIDPNGIETYSTDQSAFASTLRHLSFGAELFPEKIITLRIGYNYRRHADLPSVAQTGLAGFTTGLGINLSGISLNYGLSGYYHSGMVHNFSLAANLSRLHR